MKMIIANEANSFNLFNFLILLYSLCLCGDPMSYLG
ncbi:hypothetical protein Nhal_2713 [Nitrosococcus halophilus Nc 4]|uniref:Uncharacterized protein n=1 Tax=Nitrosococcus halophilus (strain Nc4) TaxID=472759 RepID=D5BXA5_NITHN|nr:hypothetical protein Nhal_2713 [Nitrosococcus halophilus Nc 4]